MKKFGMFLATVLFLWFSGEAVAAEAKIAYVNLQKALNESTAGKDAKAEMAAEIKKGQEQVNAKQEELKKLKEDIEKKGAILSKEAREQKEAEFNRKSQEFQKSFMQSEDVLRKKEQESVREIIKELEEIVKVLAKEKGYAYVIEKTESGLIVGPPDMDLTDDVVKIYNKQYKKEKEKK
ncbi:MAG: OmpH family outer membrane protein [Deltaproteobacteria bacterium]|nr:OmpH family outer membrane protein [Deltaproteobacteria bacterium]